MPTSGESLAQVLGDEEHVAARRDVRERRVATFTGGPDARPLGVVAAEEREVAGFANVRPTALCSDRVLRCLLLFRSSLGGGRRRRRHLGPDALGARQGEVGGSHVGVTVRSTVTKDLVQPSRPRKDVALALHIPEVGAQAVTRRVNAPPTPGLVEPVVDGLWVVAQRTPLHRTGVPDDRCPLA